MAIFNLLNYRFPANCDRTFIFDTNIWIYLFSNLHEDREREINAYSNLLDQILENECRVLIPGFVISEFSNVLLRANYNTVKEQSQNELKFKYGYVGSQAYLDTVGEINSYISEILGIEVIDKISDDFSQAEIESIMEDFKIIDWNDSCLIHLAMTQNSIIVTNDRDFVKVNSNRFDVIILR